MKRKGNIFHLICDMDNLRMADAIARKGKSKQQGVIDHAKNSEANLLLLRDMLIDKTYRTGEYKLFTKYEPKAREIACLDYFPHRILHWAVMLQLEGMFRASFTADTYSCISGRGIHGLARAIKKALKDVNGTRYCLKLDIRKFYPTIDHDILKKLLRRKIKCADTLWLLDGIIDSAPGLPIGNHLSSWFANYYMSGLDHYLKERLGVRYYCRYLDDMVIFSDNKPFLHHILAEIKQYVQQKLNLTLKQNYQVFPVASRGVRMGGYVFYHTHMLLKPEIKKNYAREMAGRRRTQVIAGFTGWAAHCDSKHLVKKLNRNEKLQRIQHHKEQQRI